MYGVEYAIARLLTYDNVRIYFYHDRWETVTDLDNYKDYTHYGKWINSGLTQAIAADEGRLTKESYITVLNAMREYIRAYDFDSIFN
jgi:hypothetical protein